MKQLFKLQQKIEKLKQQRDKARAEVQRLRTVYATEDSTTEYGIKEMHIDCEKKDFEVGKWYRSRYGATARYERPGIGTGYYSLAWGNWYMQDFNNWQLATPKEIKEVLTKRCKELGLFDGEFECLSGYAFSNQKEGLIEYWEKDDILWIGLNLAYEKGKFAKLVEKKNIATDQDIPNSLLILSKFGLTRGDGMRAFFFNHTQLSYKSREYLSQFDNVIIE